MAEGLGESFSTIGECIEDIKIDIKLFPTKSIMHLVSEFYGQVFIFLSEVMDWIMAKKRKRLLKSFNDDLVATVEKDLDRIVKRAERIQRRAAQSSRAEGQFVRHKIENLDNRVIEDMRLGSTGLARQLADRQYVEDRLQLHEARIEAYRREDLIRQERLGLSLKLLLQENVRSERSQPLLLDVPESFPGESHRNLTIPHKTRTGKYIKIMRPVYLANFHLSTQFWNYSMILRPVPPVSKTISVETGCAYSSTTTNRHPSSLRSY